MMGRPSEHKDVQVKVIQHPSSHQLTSGFVNSSTGMNVNSTPPSPGSSAGVGFPNGDGNANGNGSDSNMGAGAYKDYSEITSSTTYNDDYESDPPKEQPFPVKLHRILSNPEYSDIVSWLPHGRSWRVLRSKDFEEKVIPLYFRHSKYASFMRQVSLVSKVFCLS